MLHCVDHPAECSKQPLVRSRIGRPEPVRRARSNKAEYRRFDGVIFTQLYNATVEFAPIVLDPRVQEPAHPAGMAPRPTDNIDFGYGPATLLTREHEGHFTFLFQRAKKRFQIGGRWMASIKIWPNTVWRSEECLQKLIVCNGHELVSPHRTLSSSLCFAASAASATNSMLSSFTLRPFHVKFIDPFKTQLLPTRIFSCRSGLF